MGKIIKTGSRVRKFSTQHTCKKCSIYFYSKKACKTRTPKFCSKKCYGLYIIKTWKKCKVCDTYFYKFQHKSRGGNIFCSISCSNKYSLGKKKKNKRSNGDIHKRYKNNKSLNKNGTCYASFHTWVKRHYGSADRCEMFGCKYPRLSPDGRRWIKKPRRYEWSLKHGYTYQHNREAFWMLCPSCHRKYDYRKATKIT